MSVSDPSRSIFKYLRFQEQMALQCLVSQDTISSMEAGIDVGVSTSIYRCFIKMSQQACDYLLHPRFLAIWHLPEASSQEISGMTAQKACDKLYHGFFCLSTVVPSPSSRLLSTGATLHSWRYTYDFRPLISSHFGRNNVSISETPSKSVIISVSSYMTPSSGT